MNNDLCTTITTPNLPRHQTPSLLLQNTAVGHNLTAAQLETITADFTLRQFAVGDLIFVEGDAGNVLYLLWSGEIRIFLYSLDGHETSVTVYNEPGTIFGELAVIDSLPRSANGIAVKKTAVLQMKQETFVHHMRTIPQLALNFMTVLSHRVRYNTRQFDSLTTLGIRSRLARKLLELAQSCGDDAADGIRLQTGLNQTELASLIGTTRESINKTLRQFRKKGWIETGKDWILLRNLAQLEQLAEG